jgi:hypothetical protein
VSGFWWGVLVVVALWIFFSMRSKVNSARAFSAVDEAERWFQAHAINPRSIRFRSYKDRRLVRNQGAIVVVGTARDRQGEPVGFVLEVLAGVGVLEGELLMPSGIATWHKNAANIMGVPLIDVLVEKAASHGARYHPPSDTKVQSQESLSKSPEGAFRGPYSPLKDSERKPVPAETCPSCGGPARDRVCWSCGAKW